MAKKTTQEKSQVQSILDDPDYQTNSLKWLATQAHQNKDSVKREIVDVQHKRVAKLIDVLANKNFEILKKSSKVIGLRILAYETNGIRKPEFNLLEMAAVYDAEPLVRKSVTRQLNLWFKQDFTFTGEDQRLVNYIRKRFKTIAYATGIPTNELFKQIVRALLKYSNAFVVKVRDVNASTGVPNNGLAPVAGYFPVSALNMFPKFDDGRLVKWVRFLKDGSRFHEYDPRDVIHFTLDREEDFIFGKPRMLGVIEDVAALRRIEENVEVLIAKFLFPIYQLAVGTPEAPCRYYPDGSSEIDLAQTMVQNMHSEGMLVTSERFKLEVVGAMNEALKADPYLAHFKNRVYTGLGVSAVDMGEGDTANRATADNISQNLKDLVIEDQLSFAAQVEQYMLGELFLEHPEKISALNAFGTVRLRFTNVDLDNQIKHENHAINLFNNEGITQGEFRQMLGLDPMTDADQLDTQFHRYQMPIAIIGARDEPWTVQAKKALAAGPTANAPQVPAPGTGASGAAKKGGGGRVRTKRPGTPAKRAPATKSQPENQFGKNPGPTRRKSSVEEDLIGPLLADLTATILTLHSRDEIVNTIKSRFQSEKDSSAILSIVQDALQKSDSMGDLRANLVAGFMLIADEFMLQEEDQEF